VFGIVRHSSILLNLLDGHASLKQDVICLVKIAGASAMKNSYSHTKPLRATQPFASS